MRLRHTILLQANSPTQDTTGQPVESWSTYRECRAHVSDFRGKEGDTPEDKIEATVTVRAKIRFPHQGPLPLPTHRFRYREGTLVRTINILTVRRSDPSRQWLELEGVEVQP